MRDDQWTDDEQSAMAKLDRPPLEFHVHDYGQWRGFFYFWMRRQKFTRVDGVVVAVEWEYRRN